MTNMTSPKIFILLLNYNNATDTLACAESLLKIHTSCIVIIDNASTNESFAQLQKWSEIHNGFCIDEAILTISDSRITVIQNHQNYGFAGGNATGVRYALANGADYVVLLNNDTLVEPGFIQPLLNVYRNEPHAGIVSGMIFYEEDRGSVWFSGGDTGWYREGVHRTDRFLEAYRESPFVTGCLMMIPAQLIRQIGFMDERYFLYVEDTDYCQMVREHGYRNFVARDSVIYHKIGHSTGGGYSPLAYYYSTRNRLFYHYKHYGRIDFSLFFTLFLLIKVIRGILFACQGNWATLHAMVRGIRDFFPMIRRANGTNR